MILVLFLACFLSAPFASQRFLYPLLFTRLEVKRVALHFLNDVFLLYLPLETAKRIFEGFPLLNSNFRQKN